MKRAWTRTYDRLLLLLLFLLLASCAAGNKYRADSDWVQHGLASWYGGQHHGKATASGEIFNQYAFTAAHRTLPFGTYVNVINLQNNRDVVVKVNDRGPFIRRRVIDLSYAAAKKIGLLQSGVERVRVEVVKHQGQPPSPAATAVSTTRQKAMGAYAVQIGAFRNKENAYNLKKTLDRHYESVYVIRSGSFGHRLYRVRIGPFPDQALALQISNRLAGKGYQPFVARVED